MTTHEGTAAGEKDPSEEDNSPRHKAPTKLPAGSHRADSTQQNYKTAAKYINQWLAENDHVTFEELTDEHVEADHLQNFVENIMFWLAVTPFKTNTGWLMAYHRCENAVLQLYQDGFQASLPGT